MFRAGASDTSEAAWSGDGGRKSWMQIDRELRAIAKRRCVLDLEEAELLRAAVRVEVWRELGKGSLLEYLEDVLGYSPRLAKERVRVASSLVELPEVADAFAAGELHWSAVRELTRIVTPNTQAAWLADVRGNNLRQIEDKVSCRQRGDKPSDPPRPNLRRRVVRLELDPEAYAMLLRVQQAYADERGERPDDSALVKAMSTAYLGGTAGESGRAKHQIMTVVCEACQQGFHDAGGRRIAISAGALERAQCDAQRIGSDAVPGRATQDVSPMVRRFVWRRERSKCCVPGCRATRFLEIHHIVARAAGGSHGADNLVLLCDGHHVSLHDGKLTITGKAPNVEVRTLGDEAHVGRDAPHVGSDALADADVPTHVGSNAPVDADAPHVGFDARTDVPTHVGSDARADADVSIHVGSDARADAESTRDRSTPTPDDACLPSKPPVPSKFELVARHTEATRALVQLGFTKREAAASVEAAATHVGRGATLETLLYEALRRCPRPCS